MQVKTPDIGVEKATVAEILVKVGDQISENDSLILLESDKASVEVPSTASGVVKSILVNQGDEVTEGTALIELEAAPVKVMKLHLKNRHLFKQRRLLNRRHLKPQNKQQPNQRHPLHLVQPLWLRCKCQILV